MSAILLSLCCSPQAAAAPPEPPARAVYGEPSTEERARHAAMLALLEDVRLKTPRQNAYLGDQPLKNLLKSRAELDLERVSPMTLARFDYDIGMQLLRLGRTDEAVTSLSASHARLAALPRAEWPPFAERLEYDLGVAYMRKGETDNCDARHTAQSCLLPIEGQGVHADKTGSREGMRWLRAAVKDSPDEIVRLCARWLLNIAAMTVGEYPDALSEAERIPPSVYASESPFPRFRDVAPELGLNDFDLAGGVVIEDLDGDGLLDVFTSSSDTSTGLDFHHNNGDGTFEERAEANLAGLYGGLNLVSGDADNDGWVDILVLRGGWLFGSRGQIPRSLLQNRGGTFLDVTISAGLNKEFFPSQAGAFADYDLDGDLDLYIGAEANIDNLFAGQLFRNRGDATFEDVARTAQVENVRYCKGVAWGDYDADRYPDLYCNNLDGRNRLYHNLRDGTFQDVAETLGVIHPLNGFSTWFFDCNNDGALDIWASAYEIVDPSASLRLYPVVASYLGLPYQGDTPVLYYGDGRGGFRRAGPEANLHRLNLPMGSNFGDLDNDGYLDVYLGTGYPAYDGLVPNVLYWNRGGKRFLDVSAAAGVGHLQKGHGVAFADLDQDGDLDLFEQMGGAYPGDGFGDTLYENPGFGNHWLEVACTGVRSNRFAVGTRLHAEFVDGGERRHVWRWVVTGGSFGVSPHAQYLGLGKAKVVERKAARFGGSR